MPGNSEETKRRLFQAATDEFTTHGIAGARIDRIAQAAGANKQLIYAYFGNKRELYEAVVSEHVTRFLQEVPFDVTDLPGHAVAMFDFYVEHPGGDAENDFLQRATFKYVSEDGHVASEKLIRRDIDELQRLTSKVEAFVDMHLAHLDRRQVPLVATFNDLDDALNGLDRIACKYLTLLTGGSRATLAPTIQEPWTDIFNVPLRKP